MGFSRIWFYGRGPDGGVLSEIDLGVRFTLLQPQDDRIREDTWSLNGAVYTDDRGGVAEVIAEVENFSIRALSRRKAYHQLLGLQRHLLAGGLCALCLDSDRAFASVLVGAVNQGDDSFTHRGDLFGWLPGNLVAGDDIAIESPNPHDRLDALIVGSTAGVTLDSTRGCDFDHPNDEGHVLLREINTWVALQLPQGHGPILQPEDGASVTLSMRLRVVPAAVQAFGDRVGEFAGEGSPVGYSFESAYAEYLSPGGGA